ncbi:6632_t:CDS:1 [Racocetra persica]|uniref:6632_t:CDS:1 n=1 Tax=Racocetra persica TaxID=160502 RepID=A0ACA9S3V0_9GLOM|nr:6632_t:CDS:1 [Racocetra persica]
MTSNTNNNSGRSEILDPLYEVLLYQKKDIIAIQKKLGTNSKANQTAVHQSNKAKTLPDLYELLLESVGDLIPIEKNLNIDGNSVLVVEYRSNKTREASMDISIGEIYNLLVCLEEDIITIQDELGIIGYSNRGRAEEADENARAYLRKFEKFHGPLEDDPGVVLKKYGEMGVKKIRFTGEGLPLIPNLTPQQ